MCKHEKTFMIGGKVSDMAFWVWPDDSDGDGYVPRIPGIGGGDYIEIEICTDCGAVLGFPTGEDFQVIMNSVRD